MNYFGKSWSSVCENKVPTPIGELCYHCEELIESGDRGLIIPCVGDIVQERPIHLCCFIREVVGSVGHQQKKCSCYGGNEEDPPAGMTKKEAAVAAWEFHKKHEF